MSDRYLKTISLGELTANGATDPKKLGSYQDKCVTISATGGADFTVKLVGCDREDITPDFTVVTGDDNEWGYQSFFDKNAVVSTAVIPGSTGVVIAANGTYRLIWNDENSAWCGIEVSGYTAGSMKAFITVGDNE